MLYRTLCRRKIRNACKRSDYKFILTYFARQFHQAKQESESKTDEHTLLDHPFFNPAKHSDVLIQSSSPICINLESSKSTPGHRLYLGKFPSVTTVLKHTKPKGELWGLRVWQQSQIEELGEEQFDASKKEALQRGTTFHEVMRDLFVEPSPHGDNTHITSGYLKSVGHVLPEITHISAVESVVVHETLGYAGTVDLVAKYKGTHAVIDWKTSQKPKTRLSACHSYPVQVAAYAGAINYDSNYPFQISNGVLVIAYRSGDPADVLIMDREHCLKYWKRWLQRLRLYKDAHSSEICPVHSDTMKGECGGIEHGSSHISQQYHASLKQGCKSLGSGRPVSNYGRPIYQLGKLIPDDELRRDPLGWRIMTLILSVWELFFDRFIKTIGKMTKK